MSALISASLHISFVFYHKIGVQFFQVLIFQVLNLSSTVKVLSAFSLGALSEHRMPLNAALECIMH